MTSTLTSRETILSTPQYVLLDVNRRIGPKLQADNTNTVIAAIYGFTNKSLYDAFRLNTKQPLIPYPLVKRYLTKMIEEAGDTLSLVILDANNPSEAILNAASITDVLDAHLKGDKTMSPTHQLTLDVVTQSYRVEALA